MKRKILKSIIITVLCVFGFLSTTNAISYEEIQAPILEELKMKNALKESYGENYKEYLEMNAYEVSLSGDVENLLLSESGVYPKFYGGMYINENSTNLVIQIVEGKSLTTKEGILYDNIIGLDKTIAIEYVENSYADLESVNNRIIEYIMSDEKREDLNMANYIDIKNNAVIVELENNTLEEQNWFRENVIDSDLIIFKDYETILEDATTTLKAGAKIPTSSDYCSMGFRAKVNGTSGYFTAGHCVSDNETISTGTVQYRYYSGKLDAAFVKVNSSYSPSNSLYKTSGSNTTLSTAFVSVALPVGAELAKVGATTGYTSGTVTITNYSDTFNNVTFTNLVYTNIYCSGGDSGGPVFSTISGAGSNYIAGILKACSTTSTSAVVFSRSDYLYDTLNYTLY